MRLAILLAALAVSAGGCATHPAKSEVNAVVTDEKARATAAAVAERTADSVGALEAGAEAASDDAAAPR
jgi:hypothetical protein